MRSIYIIAVLAVVILATHVSGSNSYITIPPITCKPGGKGRCIVKIVADTIRKSKIFPEDYGLLERIACIESNYGWDSNTCRSNGGIWQVDEIAYMDTKDIKSHRSLKKKLELIKIKYGIDWLKTSWKDLRKPFYSGLAAALYISNIPEAIPADVEGQAKYWKKYYNTSGKVEHFLKKCSKI